MMRAEANQGGEGRSGGFELSQLQAEMAPSRGSTPHRLPLRDLLLARTSTKAPHSNCAIPFSPYFSSDFPFSHYLVFSRALEVPLQSGHLLPESARVLISL